MKCRGSLVALAGAAWATVTGAELPAEWRNWQYSRPITGVPAADLVRVTVPLEVWGQAQETLADLRVIDDAGAEVPYVLHARTALRATEWQATSLSEAGFVPGEHVQVVADVGAVRRAHDTVEIEVAEGDFFAWVEVAASDDRRDWRVVRARAPAYRFEREGLGGSQCISYSRTEARWLRLRLAASETLTVRRVRVAEDAVREAELLPLPVALEPDADAPRGERRWLVDFGAGRPPVGGVRAVTTHAEFHRPVKVAVSHDGAAWQTVTQGEFYRYPARPSAGDDGGPQERLELRFGERAERRWRLSVFDRNDLPIADLRVDLLGTPRHVVFRTRPGVAHRLLHGNSRVEAPVYDLARLTQRDAWEAAPAAALGPAERNAGWVSPEPWSERHPAVLWGALALAVLVIGTLAVRALR